MRIPLISPKHAPVANAIGAIASKIIQRGEITITQPVQGIFRVFKPEGPLDFKTHETAVKEAEAQAVNIAQKKAFTVGAQDIDISVSRDINSVKDPDTGSTFFFEEKITAIATGNPRTTKINDILPN